MFPKLSKLCPQLRLRCVRAARKHVRGAVIELYCGGLRQWPPQQRHVDVTHPRSTALMALCTALNGGGAWRVVRFTHVGAHASQPTRSRRRVVPPVFPWPLRALLLHRVQRSAHRLRTATSDPHARRQRIFGAVRWAVVGPGSADVSLHLTTEGNSSELFLGRDWLDRDLAAAGSHTHISQGTHHRRSELQQYAAAAGGNFPYPVCAATAVGG